MLNGILCPLISFLSLIPHIDELHLMTNLSTCRHQEWQLFWCTKDGTTYELQALSAVYAISSGCMDVMLPEGHLHGDGDLGHLQVVLCSLHTV